MKHLCPALLILLLLSACARVGAEPEGIEKPIIREVVCDENITWRLLDVAARKNAKTIEWLDGIDYSIDKESYPLGDGKSFVEEIEESDYHYKIILRREGRSDEILLQAQYDVPQIVDLLDDRFFVFRWNCAGHFMGINIYDLELRQTVPIELLTYVSYLGNSGGAAYFCDSVDEYGWSQGRVYRVDWTVLREGGELRPVILAESRMEGLSWLNVTTGMLLTGDARYLIAQSEGCDELYVFDLQEDRLALRLAFDDGYIVRSIQRDERTVYMYNFTWHYNETDKTYDTTYITLALEITLPWLEITLP